MNILPTLFNKLVNGSHRAKAEWLLRTVDLSRVRCFVLFVGNPRSGTTLVRGLLDAHPNVIVSNEVHALQCIAHGESWRVVAGRIMENARRFSKNPVWRGYSYQVSESTGKQVAPTFVLGDKKSGGTTKLIREDAGLLERLTAWSPVPVRLLHCIRNPYDVIATKTRRNNRILARNVQDYFQTEQTAALATRMVGQANCKRIYHEQLIEQPDEVMRNLSNFLELQVEDTYLNACRALISDKPNQSRHQADWPPETLASVAQNALACDHLACYLDQGRLPFE